MENDKTGGPAFPFTPNEQMKLPDGTWDQDTDFGESGMTLQQYAAIKLRVPESGTDWLDAMIRKARRMDIATAAMQGLPANYLSVSTVAKEADALLAAMEVK